MDRACRICGRIGLTPFLDLGEQPWCNDFITKEFVGKEKTYPLIICLCDACSAVQTSHTVAKETMYEDHLYLSGITQSMKAHFNRVASKVCSLVDNGLVVDIGSNDGTLLSAFLSRGMSVLGVDPCASAANVAIRNGIETKINFFDLEVAEEILDGRGKARVVSAANVFYHVEDLHSITKGIKRLLHKDGIFVMHGSYLPAIMKKKAFDIMYHEHLLYYRMQTLQTLLGFYDLEVFDVDEEPQIHGGSIVAFVAHRGAKETNPKVGKMVQDEIDIGFNDLSIYLKFAEDIKGLKEQLGNLISSLRGSIYAFGAPAKGTVLLNYCGFTSSEIALASEVNKLKFDRYIPCTGIPIMDEQKVEEPDYYLMLSWNFKEEFCKSDIYTSGKRKFVIPLPKPEILSASTTGGFP